MMLTDDELAQAEQALANLVRQHQRNSQEAARRGRSTVPLWDQKIELAQSAYTKVCDEQAKRALDERHRQHLANLRGTSCVT
jgi:hypothetical protein